MRVCWNCQLSHSFSCALQGHGTDVYVAWMIIDLQVFFLGMVACLQAVDTTIFFLFFVFFCCFFGKQPWYEVIHRDVILLSPDQWEVEAVTIVTAEVTNGRLML